MKYGVPERALIGCIGGRDGDDGYIFEIGIDWDAETRENEASDSEVFVKSSR